MMRILELAWLACLSFHAGVDAALTWPTFRDSSSHLGSISCALETGNEGTCISLKDCSHHPWKFGASRPVICGWSGASSRDPLVCCPPVPAGIEKPAGNIENPLGRDTISADFQNASRRACSGDGSSERFSEGTLAECVHDLLTCGCVGRPKNESCPARTQPSENLYIFYQVTAGYAVEFPGKFPWMAVVGANDSATAIMEWFCGGTLISDRHVMTAAHCVAGNPRVYIVRLGEHDLLTAEDGAKTADFTVDKIVTHPNFKPPHFYHDLAILTLDRQVEFSEFVRPVCLPSGIPTEIEPSRIYVMGWGQLGIDKERSSILQYANVPLVPTHECNASYARQRINMLRRYPHGITDDLLCAAGSYGQDACKGDSGGPLVRLDRNSNSDDAQYTVIGVVTGGSGCGDSQFPGLYASVQAHLPWILEQLI